MSEKIVVVSMVKNEADIIESFIRYYAAFADNILVADHSSDDGTWEILEKLKEEFPFISTSRVIKSGLVLAEVMTALMNKAAKELNADWVLPMDADEFLLPNGSYGVRDALENIKNNAVLLTWIDHEVPLEQYDANRFLLNQSCRRSKTPKGLNKVIVKGEYVRKTELRLITGNHGLENASKDAGPIRYSGCDTLTLAHFPFRSLEQYMSKNVLGWLANVEK